ncbi:MAG: nicotinate (nicotinamide) nucleotide adenylyltransferase [Bacteroidia bacterium]
MKTGLFFGSFNPVHTGHLIIANYMAEFTDLDEVWFVVSPLNPLKKKETLLADHHRLALVTRAIGDDYKKIKVSNIEFNLPQPSYTRNTLAYLEDKYPQNKFALIMGADNLITLPKWRNADLIIRNYEIYVYPRLQQGTEIKTIKGKINYVDAPVVEISSSFIREAIAKGRDVRFYLPEKAFLYIDEMNFYKKRKI